jgi:hypothetical protein
MDYSTDACQPRGAAHSHVVTARAVPSLNEWERPWVGLDHVKDRVTEAAGMLADDDSLTSEGKLGQLV